VRLELFKVHGRKFVAISRQHQKTMTPLLASSDFAGVGLDSAVCINLYTQDAPNPQWFKFMSEQLNAKDRVTLGGGFSVKARMCLKFLKFFIASLKGLPERFRFNQECWRGINWVFPTPVFHDLRFHFPEGKSAAFYVIRSFSESKDVALAFAGEGCRTLFKMNPGCRGFSISIFSQFPEEKEVVFLPLEFYDVVKSTQKMKVCAEEAWNKASKKHCGEPDEVVLQHKVPFDPLLHKVEEIESLPGAESYMDLVYYFTHGMHRPVEEAFRAVHSAKLVIQARDAILASVASRIGGKDVLVLAGATGSGKSTLCNWLAGRKLSTQTTVEEKEDEDLDFGMDSAPLERKDLVVEEIRFSPLAVTRHLP